jgi:hypothetical protein
MDRNVERRPVAFQLPNEIRKTQVEIVSMLLAAGADPDGKLPDFGGHLSLENASTFEDRGSCWFAASSGNLPVLKKLIAAGADPWLLDIYGDHALSAARDFEMKMRILRRRLRKTSPASELPKWKLLHLQEAKSCTNFLQKLRDLGFASEEGPRREIPLAR